MEPDLGADLGADLTAEATLEPNLGADFAAEATLEPDLGADFGSDLADATLLLVFWDYIVFNKFNFLLIFLYIYYKKIIINNKKDNIK